MCRALAVSDVRYNVPRICRNVAAHVPQSCRALAAPLPQYDPHVPHICHSLVVKLAHHGTTLNRNSLPWFYYRFDRILPEAAKARPKEKVLQLNSALAEATEDHWIKQLDHLVEQGYLVPALPPSLPNLLLGVMDRQTFLTGIEFQSAHTRGLTILDFARATIEMLFEAYGTVHYRSCKETGQWVPLDPLT